MATKHCLVCDWSIEDDGQGVEVGDGTFTVCGDECAAKLRADPDDYLEQRKPEASSGTR